MGTGRATVLALVGLAIVFGTALGVMTGVGAVLHVLAPDRPFDAYALFHDQAVVLSLVVVSVLWVLPPHPWAKELVEILFRHDPPPRFPVPVTGRARVTVVSVFQGRAPPPFVATA